MSGCIITDVDTSLSKTLCATKHSSSKHKLKCKQQKQDIQQQKEKQRKINEENVETIIITINENSSPKEVVEQILASTPAMMIKPSTQIKQQTTKTTTTKINQSSTSSFYNVETCAAVRENDLETLRSLARQTTTPGIELDACNRFGESLLHMACRRGHTDIVRFLLLEVRVRADVVDDVGRTAFHDACWNATPNPEVMDTLIEAAPVHFLLKEDRRGHTPFDYTPRQHWGYWVDYLITNLNIVREKLIQQQQKEREEEIESTTEAETEAETDTDGGTVSSV